MPLKKGLDISLIEKMENINSEQINSEQINSEDIINSEEVVKIQEIIDKMQNFCLIGENFCRGDGFGEFDGGVAIRWVVGSIRSGFVAS